MGHIIPIVCLLLLSVLHETIGAPLEVNNVTESSGMKQYIREEPFTNDPLTNKVIRSTTSHEGSTKSNKTTGTDSTRGMFSNILKMNAVTKQYIREEPFTNHPLTDKVIRSTTSHKGSTKSNKTTVTNSTRGMFSNILKMNAGNPKLVGDIVKQPGRSAISCTSCLWPINSTNMVYVPYVISPDYTARARAMILKAMGELMTVSCVRFVERQTENDYINIYSDNGCWSVLGRSGGKQGLSLATQGCMLHGVIQHELFHALGFTHEINRSDRDYYIRVITENIKAGEGYQFKAENTNNLGLPYEYHSVMHYDRYAYSKNGRETIVPLFNASAPLGQTDGVSTLDVAKLNKLYKCNLCRTLLDGKSGSVTSGNYPSQYPSDSSCLYLIRVPEDQVLLTFQNFDVQSSSSCTPDYLRVYDGYNKTSPVLLDNFCGSRLPPSLVASSNSLLLEFVSDGALAGSGFKASYSSVTCGGTFLMDNDVITSPNYPWFYDDLQNCAYTITAPAGYKISLTFSMFKLELADSDCVSAGDFVVVYDGNSMAAPVLGKFCSYAAIPPPQMSSGNSMVLYFKSNMAVSYLGFRATYSFVPNV